MFASVITGSKELIELLIKQYIKTADKYTPPSAITLIKNMELDNPFLWLFEPGHENLTLVKLFIQNLPKPYYIKPDSLYNKALIRAMGTEVTLLEAAIFFGAEAILNELLKLYEYKQIAMNKKELLGEKSLFVGKANIFWILSKTVTLTPSPKHLLIALGHLNDKNTTELIKEIKNGYGGDEIMNYKDKNSNNILHLIARFGKRNLLHTLKEMNIFSFENKENYESTLKEKNSDKCCPYVEAIKNGNLDIANALFIKPKSIEDYSEDEFNYITNPALTFNAMSHFMNSKVFAEESKLWSMLIPQREKVLLVLDKLTTLAFFVKPKRSYPKKVNTCISYLATLIEEGNIGSVLGLILFRRDMFYVTNLLESTFKVKETIINSLISNTSLLPLLYIFIKIGLSGIKKEELLPIFQHPKVRKDETFLYLLQVFDILKRNSADSSQSLKSAPQNSIFISPFNFFTGKSSITIGTKTEISFEELDCLVPNPAKADTQSYFNLDLAILADSFLKLLCFKSFATILLYAYKYEMNLFKKILANIDVNALFSITFQANPQELPWVLDIIPNRFDLVFDCAKENFVSQSDNSKVIVMPRSIASILFYGIFYSGKRLALKDMEGNLFKHPTAIMKSLLENTVYNILGLYKEAKKPVKGTNLRGKRIDTYNDTTRKLNDFSKILTEVLDIAKNYKTQLGVVANCKAPDMAIPDYDLANLILSILDPSKELIPTTRGLMTINVNTKEILEYIQAFAEVFGKTLTETASMLFTDQFIFGIKELNGIMDKHFLDIKVKFISDTNKPNYSFKILSTKEEKKSKLMCGKMMSEPNAIFGYAEIEYQINVSGLKLESIAEQLEAMNMVLNREVFLELLKNHIIEAGNTTDFLLNGKHFVPDNFIAKVNFESVRDHYDIIDSMFYTDLRKRLESLCSTEIQTLQNSLAVMKRDCDLTMNPKKIGLFKDLGVPNSIKDILSLVLRTKFASNYEIVLRTKEEWTAQGKSLSKLIEESLNYCTIEENKMDKNEITLLIPENGSLDGSQQWILPETHIEFPALKIYASEASFIRKMIYLMRSPQTPLRIDMKEFVFSIALPLAQVLSSRESKLIPCNDPLLLIQFFFENSVVFKGIVKRILFETSQLYSLYNYNTKAIAITFAESSEKNKKNKTNLEGYPIIDQLVQIADADISFTANVCLVTLKYDKNWEFISNILAQEEKPLDEKTTNNITVKSLL